MTEQNEQPNDSSDGESNTPRMEFGPPERPQDGDWKYITDRTVSSRRVAFTDDMMERYGFKQDDRVDVVLYPADREGERVTIPEARIVSDNRISVPSHKYDRHELGGATVDVHVRLAERPEDTDE